MGRFHSRIFVALLIGLLTLPCWALTGPQTAQQLNQRLAATPTQCVGGKPPHTCSGVLIRPMAEDHPQPFWHHDAEAEARGTERFQWLREDLDVKAVAGKQGYILMDGFSAIGQGKAYQVVEAGGAVPNEVMVRNWAEDAPNTLAVQALYYDVSDADSLLRVQRGQREYFEATGNWLPLVRLAINEQGGTFGFNQQEQLYNGYKVAGRVNSRYARKETACPDGRAAYYCYGVLVRATDVGDFHSWDPSPPSIEGNGVSFSYLGSDITSDVYKPQGFIFSELSRPSVQPVEFRCVYPFDAHSGSAPDRCTFRKTCAELGIDSVEAWTAQYRDHPYWSCSFAGTAEGFQLAIDVRNLSGVQDPYNWMEVIIAAWPLGVGRDLPLEAFFYRGEDHGKGSGLKGAQAFQLDYWLTTKRYLPVLEMIPLAADGQVFVFRPEDQQVR